MNKIERELEEYRKFKKDFIFNQLELTEKDNKVYCLDLLLKDGYEETGITDKWINVGYKIHGSYPRLLSNLFPYKFEFREYTLSSIESFFQAIKFKDPEIQKLIFSYSRTDAVVIKDTNDRDWKEDGKLYLLGKEYIRDSKEYSDLVDEVYISAIQNPLYRGALKNVKLPMIHAMGETDKNKTVWTRYEFEFTLNCLSAFLKSIDKF